MTDQHNGNGTKKLSSLVSTGSYVIVIGGAILSALAWGIALRGTVDRDHDTLLKLQVTIDALQLKVNTLENNSIQPREIYEAMKTGVERNQAQDIRLQELQKRLDRLEGQPR